MENLTEKQLLRNPDIVPTNDVIADGLGITYKTFINCVEVLKQQGITLMDWRYYNDGKAWLSKGEYKWTTPRGANKVKPIFWLSIWEGFFKVSFFFGYDIKDELFSLPISTKTKELIKTLRPMGKTMRFIPVVLDIKNDSQLNDVYELAQFKKIK